MSDIDIGSAAQRESLTASATVHVAAGKYGGFNVSRLLNQFAIDPRDATLVGKRTTETIRNCPSAVTVTLAVAQEWDAVGPRKTPP